MDPDPTGRFLSGALAIVVVGAAFLLSWRQSVERRRRSAPATEGDRRYFARQDRRRFRGAILLGLIGLGIGVGDRIDYRADDDAKIAFIAVWLAVFLLLLQLLAMAFVDLWSTRRFAERKHRELASERRRTLEREVDQRRDAASARDRDGPDRDV